MQELSLYIHIPFCLEKCPYCDFHSIAVEKKSIEQKKYADLLMRQLDEEVERLALRGRSLVSIYFGGGTPSLMNASLFEAVITRAVQYFALTKDCEITVETNPATAAVENFKSWLNVGVNRVSIGAQSFQPHLLKKLGRSHSADAAKQAVREAAEAGFKNISADLIFGIEGESFEDLQNDLLEITALPLQHISAYQLTVEPATPLATWVRDGSFQLPKEEILAEMQETVFAFLEKRGFDQYEISNYAKIPPLLKGGGGDFRSRHNLQYWRYGEYLGIGSGAVSTVNGQRWRTTRQLKKYFQSDWGFEEIEIIDAKTAWKERWMMGLRLAEGVAMTEADHGFKPIFALWMEKGWAQLDGPRVTLTNKGRMIANSLILELFSSIE
ncbi:MAG: radical SAM family heme chaperone HemW [Deltaproteobacteria bacterium]|nr:radical SAM family heme chaperone HemW [Deltaproteobacteria bacterium]